MQPAASLMLAVYGPGSRLVAESPDCAGVVFQVTLYGEPEPVMLRVTLPLTVQLASVILSVTFKLYGIADTAKKTALG